MTKSIDQQRPCIGVGDTEIITVDYTAHLHTGELIASVATPTEVTTTDLTIANEAVSTATIRSKETGEDIAVGRAIQFKVSGQLAANSPYTVTVTATTDSSPARVIARNITFTAE